MHAAHAEAGHARRQVQVRRDAQRARVRVLHVKVVARQTHLDHRLQAVHEQLRVVLVLRLQCVFVHKKTVTSA